MLPFGLKLAWFALSLSGLIGCWAVLLPLAWAIQSYWGPIAYAVGITCLEGMFCLGLVWKMSPANMPRAFCFAQVIITGLAVFCLIGVLAAITTATTLYVSKPKLWGTQDDTAVLPWRIYYLLPMLLFPLLSSSVQVIFVIFFDNFEPVDGLTCVARPLWIRFLGYAGTPFLITIPCLWLTSVSVIRVRRTHKHIRRSRRSVNFDNLDRFTAMPQRKSRPLAQAANNSANAACYHRPVSVPVLPYSDAFHLPFMPPSPDYMTAHSGHRSRRSEDSFDTVSSVSFAEMKTKSSAAELKTKSSRMFGNNTEEDDVTTPLRSFTSPGGTTRSSRASPRSIHNSDRISITQLAFNLRHEESTDYTDYFSYSAESSVPSEIPPAVTPKSEYRNPSELSSMVRSLIIFQFAIIAIHLLSSITPLVDIISASAVPAPLGTQHVALLLAAWAPVFIFGPLSAVRCQLAFWR